MADIQWSPAKGWMKAALHLPVRAAIGGCLILGGGLLLDALLDAFEAQRVSTCLPMLVGGIGGVLAGIALCWKLVETTGLAGASLLLPVLGVIAVVQMVAWPVAEAILPWDPFLRLWLLGFSAAAAILAAFYFLWARG